MLIGPKELECLNVKMKLSLHRESYPSLNDTEIFIYFMCVVLNF